MVKGVDVIGENLGKQGQYAETAFPPNELEASLKLADLPPVDDEASTVASPIRGTLRVILAFGMTAAWFVCVEWTAFLEAARLQNCLDNTASTGWWLGELDPDATFMFPLLLFAPFCWGMTFNSVEIDRLRRFPSTVSRRIGRQFRWLTGGSKYAVTAVLIFLMSLAVSFGTSQRKPFPFRDQTFAERTPVIHDEFSYLFQAKTILAGRWYWDGPKVAPELFHQMHLLNEGRVASRYVPGTGAWIAPWLAIGHPIWGYWVAAAIVSVSVYCMGIELQGYIAGVIGGVLMAVAPGFNIFSNLLLAHLPTLVGVSLFLLFFLRYMRTRFRRDALLAGFGLALGMLCRPMTAASMGLPFGIWMLAQLPWRVWKKERPLRWVQEAVAMGIPLAVGFLILMQQNQALTNDSRVAPYLLYTQIYTPSHAYGFNNKLNGIQQRNVKTIEPYDDWADNLTPQRGWNNAYQRVEGSWKWTLGVVPLMLVSLLYPFSALLFDQRLLWVAGSIVSLHLAHLPYWLDGILQHHYVFEGGALLLLVFACVSAKLLSIAQAERRLLFFAWWGLLVIFSVGVNQFQLGYGHTTPRILTGIQWTTAAADDYIEFQKLLKSSELEQPALILFDRKRSNIHVEYIRNQPPYDDAVLVGAYEDDIYPRETIHDLFPDRTLYEFDPQTVTLREIAAAETEQVPIDGPDKDTAPLEPKENAPEHPSENSEDQTPTPDVNLSGP